MTQTGTDADPYSDTDTDTYAVCSMQYADTDTNASAERVIK